MGSMRETDGEERAAVSCAKVVKWTRISKALRENEISSDDVSKLVRSESQHKVPRSRQFVTKPN